MRSSRRPKRSGGPVRIDQSFSREFSWRGHALRVGFVLPEAKSKISAGIALMSKETIRHRFFGIKNGFTDRELKYLTEIDGVNHFALGLEEAKAPERGVAIMRMVRDDLEPTEAEVAILLVDEFQKLGLGTLLMHFCILAALERGITLLRFTYLPDNQSIVKLIRRFGTVTPKIMASDYVQMQLALTPELASRAEAQLAEFFAPGASAPRAP